MLSEGHDLLRECLESQVDFYKVAPELRPYHDKYVRTLGFFFPIPPAFLLWQLPCHNF